MDPITAAIVSALMAGVFSGFTEVGKTATIDAYTKLKGLLNKKFGARSGVMQAIAQLESKSDSPHRQGILQEELATVNAWQDAEVLAAARHLQLMVQQQQNISLQGSPVQGSIYQVGHDQYQIGRDQWNVHADELVGPGIRRGIRLYFSIAVILAVIGLIIAFFAWVHPFAPSTASPSVQMTLTTYCNALVKGDYQTAYDQGSSGNKQVWLSESNYATVVSTHVAIRGGLVECAVSNTSDDGSSGQGTITYLFGDKSVQYFRDNLTNENGNWKVVSEQCTAGCG